MSGMSVSGVGSSVYYQTQTAPSQAVDASQEEQKALADALKEQEEGQKTLVEMMKEAREKAEEASKKRDEMLKKTVNRRYGDAAIMAYSKLARARSAGEVDSASGYARRQIAQLKAAKRSDSDNADRIQAAINQLQKAVNRASRKKRELNQEKLTAKRKARLEQEKRTQEAKRTEHQLKKRRTMRKIRELGYLREAEVDNRHQDHLQASRMEMRQQMQELSAAWQPSLETAVQGYSVSVASAAGTESAGEISVQA